MTDLKPFHYTALRKALAAWQADTAAGRQQSAGWRSGYEVGGFRTADQLCRLGLFQPAINNKSSSISRNRYRITGAGRTLIESVSEGNHEQSA